jgi:hypothetical protein
MCSNVHIVNRKRLIQHLRALETLTSEFRTDVERLGDADPFCNFILRARRDFRTRSESDHSKHAVGVKRCIEGSYKEAMRYGFKGSVDAWFAVLNARIPDAESAW